MRVYCGWESRLLRGATRDTLYLVAFQQMGNVAESLLMYFLYLDESGSPNGWQTQNHFVLGGVAIHEGQVAGLANKLDEIQTSYLGDLKVSIEFHAGDMKTGNKRWHDISKEIREKMMAEVYEVIANAQFPHLIAFASALHISKAVDSEPENLRTTFQDVCLKFNHFLVKTHKSGKPNKGLLIIDDAHKKHYQNLISAFRREGVKGTPIYNIVDIPYFSASQETRMLQLADFCVYAVYRYYEKGDSTYLDTILPQFDRRDKLHVDGLRHVTKTLACACMACASRRDLRTQQQLLTSEDEDTIEPLGGR